MSKQVLGVLLNDTHLNKDNGELVKSIFNQAIELCETEGTDKIFCGGDVFTNRSGQPLQCLTDWKEILEAITEAGLELHVIPGNHDKTDSDDERSYLDVYSERCVHLYRQWSVKIIDGVAVCFIPYFRDEKWLQEFRMIEEELEDKCYKGGMPKILITHSGFDGVVNNDGSKVVSDIKPSMFKAFDKVLIGHYHDASKLAENVIYTGSAFQNNFGENITDKGFTIIYDDTSLRFVPSKFPKYIKEVVSAKDKESLRNLIEKYDGQTDDYIRFIFTGKKEDLQNINIAEIQGKYGIDCKFSSIETDEAIELSESDSVLNYDKKAIIKDFMKFCSENEIKGSNLKYGIDLIKKVEYVES